MAITSQQAGFYRFAWVTKHIPSTDRLARSSSPHYIFQDSDQNLTDDSIRFLQEQKIEHVISLNSRADDDAIRQKLNDNHIEYTPLTVRDFTAPTLEQLAEGNAAYRKHRGGTLVWCGYGHGRTGTMITALQIYAEKDNGENKDDVSRDDYRTNRVESAKQYDILDRLKESS